MMQQRAHSWAASTSFYVGAANDDETSSSTNFRCPQAGRWQLHRAALLLLSLLLLGGGAVGSSFLLRSLRSWPDQAVSVAHRQGTGTKASSSSATNDPTDRTNDDRRNYLTSNLSLLIAGRWSTEARFHPVSFQSPLAILNDTVYCDRPSPGDVSLVYTDPTWLCKNIRVGESHRLPFSDATSSPLEELLLSRHEEMHGVWPTVGDSCGRLPDRRNNVLLLCELMLAQEARLSGGPRHWLGDFRTSSVHIPYGNCSLPQRKRMILVGMTTRDAVWYTEKLLKPGFVTDIYCSFTG